MKIALVIFVLFDIAMLATLHVGMAVVALILAGIGWLYVANRDGQSDAASQVPMTMGGLPTGGEGSLLTAQAQRADAIPLISDDEITSLSLIEESDTSLVTPAVSDSHEAMNCPTINPASGLPMVGCTVDIAGNPYGTNMEVLHEDTPSLWGAFTSSLTDTFSSSDTHWDNDSFGGGFHDD